MGLYEDCIASGESPGTCAATFGGPSSGDAPGDLSGLVGNVFGETSSGFIGILQSVKSGVTNRIVGYKLVNESGQSFKLNEGMQLGSTTGRSFDLGSSGAAGLPALVGITGTGSLSEAQFNRLTGGGGGGAARSAPAFRSTAAGLQAEQAFQAEQDRINREFTVEQDRLNREAIAEQNRLAEEAALKRGRLSTLTDLIQSFVGAQSQARDTLANLQPDPFRFAAVAGGIAPFGVTPQQGFQQQLQQFASAPAPTADPNASLPSIESAIQGLTGANVPLSPQVFGATPPGLAAGGTVAPSAQPQSFLVGEKGPEVMTVTAQGVQVTPLAGGMQEGGAIGFPFQPIQFDKETLLPALGTSGIFDAAGFSQFPTVKTTTGGVRTAPGGLGPLALGNLGIQPSLVRDVSNKQIFFIDQQGVRHAIQSPADFTKFGFNAADVLELTPQTIQSIAPERGAMLGPDFQVPIPTTQPSPFTRFSAPIIEPTTGTLLPAPFQVASQMNRLRLTNPTAFNLLLSAYEAAGVPAGAVLGGIQASLPFGQERTSTGLR